MNKQLSISALARTLVLATLLLLISACGQKGPLIVEEPPEEISTTDVGAQSTTSAQSDADE